MNSAKNIARYIFAPIVVLAGFFSVASGQTISADLNGWDRNDIGRNRIGEYSTGVGMRGTGIKEVVADEYTNRYREWKSEFLSSERGRRQWDFYASHRHFVLTITMSEDIRNGARTNQYKWSESGELISATITLGSQIDKGFPDPIYYPVINALQTKSSSLQPLTGKVLAAAKIAHEFGHLNRAASTNGTLYQLQYRLIPIYNSILQKNGFNIHDPRLKVLAGQMGGTPVEIYEDGEYWGEANAMLYLHERITEERLQRSLVARIKQNVGQYANTCRERFLHLLNSIGQISLIYPIGIDTFASDAIISHATAAPLARRR